MAYHKATSVTKEGPKKDKLCNFSSENDFTKLDIKDTLTTTKSFLTDDLYEGFTKKKTDFESQAEYNFILNCKKNKKLKCNLKETEKKGNVKVKFADLTTFENKVTNCKSFELNGKDEVDIKYLEDSIYDTKYMNEENFDLIKREKYSTSGSDDDDDDVDDDDDDDDDDEDKSNETYNISNCNFIDNMFQQVGPVSNSVVECRVCYKQIKETSKRQHSNTHTGLKPFPCCYCGARFTRKGDVLRHRKTIHRNIKPYECIICHKNFSERKILIHHLQNHDRTMYYSCATCGFKFSKKEYFQSHIQYIHPSTKEQSMSEMKVVVMKGKKQLEKLLLEENGSGKSKKLYFLGDSENLTSDQSILPSQNNDVIVKEKNMSLFDIKIEPLPPVSAFPQIKEKRNSDGYRQFISSEKNLSDNNLGILSFTHKLTSRDFVEENSNEEEDLVNKSINSAILQSKCVLDKISCDDDNLLSVYQRTKSLQSTKKKHSSCAVVSKFSHPEVHITANFNGNMKKFIIHIPSNNIDPLCKEGLDSLLNMVNYVCPGKEDIIGPVEIELH